MKDISSKTPLFDYFAPVSELKGILSIPHSGEIIPEEFKSYIQGSEVQLMQDLDFRVHELIDIQSLRENGIGVLKSNISRITVDLNRSPDKTLFAWKKNSRGIEIIKSAPLIETANDLIASFYSPYFEFLKALLYDLDGKVKVPSVIDLHSMPSKATDYHLNINPNQPEERPSFCLSDKSGLTCEKDFLAFITAELQNNYPDTTNNMPYFGGYLTEFIHSILPHGNNIQIEISRGLYMDEDTITLIPEKVKSLKENLTKALIVQYNEFYQRYKN